MCLVFLRKQPNITAVNQTGQAKPDLIKKPLLLEVLSLLRTPLITKLKAGEGYLARTSQLRVRAQGLLGLLP